MSDRLDVVPIEDPRDRRTAHAATGLLAAFNLAGVLDAADVHVAERLGRLGREPDERVLLAVALAVRALRAGSVCLDLGKAPAIAPGLGWPAGEAWRAAVEASPLLGSALRQDGEALYLDRYWQEESQVVADLATRAAASPPAVDEARLAAALGAYFADPDHADQRRAAKTACLRWTSVVTGGPGTGKTTTIARLLGVLISMETAGQPLRIALAAPTGKAAARMAQAVHEATEQQGFPGRDGRPGDPAYERVARIRTVTASTLHRLLGSRADNRTRFRHHRGNRLPHDVVVVDETSMVSLTMTARLLEAVRPEARLVLVGDADQLASIEAGAVLKDLVDGYQRSGPVSRLEVTRRYGERIGGLAEAIRTGDPDAVLQELGRGGSEVLRLDHGELPRLLRDRAVALHAAADSGDHAAALHRLDSHRLLCAHREGPFGVGHWNRVIERLLMEGSGQDWLDRWYVGQPVIVNVNDYGLDLWNGDTGVVCRDSEDPAKLVAVIGDGTAGGRTLATTRLADVSTAHAMTVHRSQGSQFDEVTVLLPEPGSRILTRELFYTAVTRARSRVRVVGSDESVIAAVKTEAQRATGLARRLR